MPPVTVAMAIGSTVENDQVIEESMKGYLRFNGYLECIYGFQKGTVTR